MQENSEKLQLLAPAGSVDQLVTAVNNGCNAVYLGLDSFNARMKAPNFTLSNLGEWVDYCHLYEVKVYVAINTSLKNDEFESAVKMLAEVYKRNVDGVIVTDTALMEIAGKLPKPFDVVASTQLNVHDRYGAEFVKKHGATTVVCARECSFKDIGEIASTGINVECFIHGAMCVCQSGQCLFSSIVGGNSGNRGLCAQPCRKSYFVEGNAGVSGYLLSARDMCGLDTARELVKAGATTFKIEGRNRRAEYAGVTSRVYSRLFDNGFKQGSDDYEALAEMFNRSMTSNPYLFGSNYGVIYPPAQNHVGVEVGLVENGRINAFKETRKGDGLKIFDGNREVCGGIMQESGTGLLKAQFFGSVANGMTVRRTTNVQLNDEILSVVRKLNVDVVFTAQVGQAPVLTVKYKDVEVSVTGDFLVEKARNSPTLPDEIAKQLSKSGNTYYTICDIVLKIDEIFIAKSQINALRRRALEALTSALIDGYNVRFANRKSINVLDALLPTVPNANSNDGNECLCVAICFNEQHLKLCASKCQAVIYKPDVIDLDAFKTAQSYGAYVDLPSFADLNYVEELLLQFPAKLFCNNVGHVELAQKLGLKYIVGFGLNIFNDYIVRSFKGFDGFAYSRELSLDEIRRFNNASGLVFVDGQIPLMQLCHCPYKVALKCDCASCKFGKPLVYRDEQGNKFVVKRRQAKRCIFELINGSKLSVVKRLNAKGRYIVDYDEAVVQHYINLNNGLNDGYCESRPYAKGRLYDKIN